MIKLSTYFTNFWTAIKNKLGVSNGIATLDANGRLKTSQLPSSAMSIVGYLDAENVHTVPEASSYDPGSEIIVTSDGYYDQSTAFTLTAGKTLTTLEVAEANALIGAGYVFTLKAGETTLGTVEEFDETKVILSGGSEIELPYEADLSATSVPSTVQIPVSKGDVLIAIDGHWIHLANTSSVSSVNGKSGAVVLTSKDVEMATDDNTTVYDNIKKMLAETDNIKYKTYDTYAALTAGEDFSSLPNGIYFYCVSQDENYPRYITSEGTAIYYSTLYTYVAYKDESTSNIKSWDEYTWDTTTTTAEAEMDSTYFLTDNLATGKTVAASTDSKGAASQAVDGNLNTRWESDQEDPQWFSIDLGQKMVVESIGFCWETASAKTYKVQFSNDGTTWTDVQNFSGTAQTGKHYRKITLQNTCFVRYIRLYFLTRTTDYGYSFYELGIYGKGSTGTLKYVGSLKYDYTKIGKLDTIDTSENTSYYPTFVSTAGGTNQTAFVSSTISYNPSTKTERITNSDNTSINTTISAGKEVITSGSQTTGYTTTTIEGGAISSSSVTATGTVKGATITSTGTISATGAISGASVTATGDVTGANITTLSTKVDDIEEKIDNLEFTKSIFKTTTIASTNVITLGTIDEFDGTAGTIVTIHFSNIVNVTSPTKTQATIVINGTSYPICYSTISAYNGVLISSTVRRYFSSGSCSFVFDGTRFRLVTDPICTAISKTISTGVIGQTVYHLTKDGYFTIKDCATTTLSASTSWGSLYSGTYTLPSFYCTFVGAPFAEVRTIGIAAASSYSNLIFLGPHDMSTTSAGIATFVKGAKESGTAYLQYTIEGKLAS